MNISQRYLVYISYIGSYFRGSQLQRNADSVTVQGTVKKALDTLPCFKKDGSSYPFFASRTDSGVHGLRAAFHVDVPYRNSYVLGTNHIKQHLNKYFAKNNFFLRVVEVLKVPDVFNARFSSVEKTYLYRVGVTKKSYFDRKYGFTEPLPELNRTYFLRTENFDIEKAREAAQLLVGEKDFRAFKGVPKEYRENTVCKINSFTIEESQPFSLEIEPNSQHYDYYHFICTGNRFLRYMVRRMVGTALAAGNNRITLDEVKNLIEKPDPSSWTSKITVPPGYGLYLLNSTFNPEHLIITEEEKNNKLAQCLKRNSIEPQVDEKEDPETILKDRNNIEQKDISVGN